MPLAGRRLLALGALALVSIELTPSALASPVSTLTPTPASQSQPTASTVASAAPTLAARPTFTTAPIATNTPAAGAPPVATPTVPVPATPTFTFTPPVAPVLVVNGTPTAIGTVAAATAAPPTATVPLATNTPIPATATPVATLPPTITATAIASGSVLVNELLTVPKKNWDGGTAPTQAQWIELFNPGSRDVNLNNWVLATSDSAHPATLVGNPVVPAHGYLVIYRRDVGLDFSQGPVQLLDPNRNVVDSVNPPVLGSDQSWQRLPDGSPNWAMTNNPTPGQGNVAGASAPDMTQTAIGQIQATVFAIQTQLAVPLPSPPATPDFSDDSLVDASEADGSTRPVRSRKPEAFPSLDISAVRSLPDESPVVTTGVVTMAPGGFDVSRGYIQAGGSGILFHSYGTTALHVGDVLTIKGRIHHLHGEVEVAALKGGEQVAGAGSLPSPVMLAPGSVGASYEGLLVEVGGASHGVVRDELTLSGDGGNARVYIFSRLGFPVKSILKGSAVTVIGVVNARDFGGFSSGAGQGYAQQEFLPTHRLVPRFPSDVMGTDPQPTPSDPVANQTPVRAETAAARETRGPRVEVVGTGRPAVPPESGSGAVQPTPFITPVTVRVGQAPVAAVAQPGLTGAVLRLEQVASSWNLPPWAWLAASVGFAGALGLTALGTRQVMLGRLNAEESHVDPPEDPAPEEPA